MLLDADLGLANVDVLLGLTPKHTLADVIEGRCELRDVLLQGPGGIRIVPAASGTQSMVHLSPAQHAGLIQAFSDIGDNLDVLFASRCLLFRKLSSSRLRVAVVAPATCSSILKTTGSHVSF